MAKIIEWWEVESLYYNTPELMDIIKRQLKLEEMKDSNVPSTIIAKCEEALNQRIEKYYEQRS